MDSHAYSRIEKYKRHLYVYLRPSHVSTVQTTVTNATKAPEIISKSTEVFKHQKPNGPIYLFFIGTAHLVNFHTKCQTCIRTNIHI